MDKTKQPKICFTDIYLKSLAFDFFRMPEGEKIEYGLDFSIKKHLSPEKDQLSIEIEVDLMKDVENPIFELKFSMVGNFKIIEEGNMELDRFAKVNGPALMFPFIREFIVDITSRSGLPALILPPINLTNVGKHTDNKKKPVKKLKNTT